MTEPTYAELITAWKIEAEKNLNRSNDIRVGYARAVLAKWGTPAPSGDVSKSGEESNMSDTELLDFICDNDRQRMVEQSGGFWRVYQDEAPLEAEHHLWQSMTSRRYSTAREAISAASKEGK